jgi:hypothetical protein
LNAEPGEKLLVKQWLISAIPAEFNHLRGGPLGKGFLTSKIDAETKFDSTDFRNTVPRFSADNRKVNQALVDVFSPQYRKEGRSAALLPAILIEYGSNSIHAKPATACSTHDAHVLCFFEG